MDAIEARRIALHRQKESKLPEIFKSIQGAANKGQTKCYIYSSLNKPTREALVAMGYGVGKELFDRNDTLVEITW